MTIFWLTALFAFFIAVLCCDLRSRKVPNRLLVAALILQLLSMLFFRVFATDAVPPFLLPGWLNAFIGLLAGFVVFLPFWFMRIMGAGDVKFIAVLGFLLGWQPMLWIVLIGGLPSGAHALTQVIAVRRGAGEAPAVPRRGVPYAGYIALAGAGWLVWQLSRV